MTPSPFLLAFIVWILLKDLVYQLTKVGRDTKAIAAILGGGFYYLVVTSVAYLAIESTLEIARLIFNQNFSYPSYTPFLMLFLADLGASQVFAKWEEKVAKEKRRIFVYFLRSLGLAIILVTFQILAVWVLIFKALLLNLSL